MLYASMISTPMMYKTLQAACADPEKFVRGGPTLTFFFFVFFFLEGSGDRNASISGSLLARQRNAN